MCRLFCLFSFFSAFDSIILGVAVFSIVLPLQLLPKVVGNVGFIFTNGELGTIRDVIEEHRVPAPARVGSVAPTDVRVPPGGTGCDPGQTSFFQVLQVCFVVWWEGRAVCLSYTASKQFVYAVVYVDCGRKRR